MTLALGVFVWIGIVGYVLGAIFRTRREQQDAVSAAWVQDRAKVDAVTSGQWDGVVHWPWNSDDFDDAA